MQKELIKTQDWFCSGFADCQDGDRLMLCGSTAYRSRDGFQSFEQSSLPFSSTNAVRLNDGRIMALVWEPESDPDVRRLGGGSYFTAFSEDNGKSFGKLAKIHAGERCYYTMNDRMIRLSSGRILIPVCLHPESLYDRPLEAAGWCACCYSDDEGQSWKWSNWLEGDSTGGHLAEPMVIRLLDGSLKMFMRTFKGYLYESLSTDEGITWQGEIPTGLRMPNSPFCIKTDPCTGWHFLVWINAFPQAKNYNYPRTPLCLGVSRDDTRTWELLCELGSDPFARYGYPSVSFTEKSLVISYNECRDKHRKFTSDKTWAIVAELSRDSLAVKTKAYYPVFGNTGGKIPDNLPLETKFISPRRCTGVSFCEHNGKTYCFALSSPGSFLSVDQNGKGSFSPPRKVSGLKPSSLIGVKNGLMALVWNPAPQEVLDAGLNGTTYSVLFSGDEGATWGEPVCVNEEPGCYYVMNDRFTRLKNGRICLAIARHPKEDFGKKIETSGQCACCYSDDEGQSWRSSNWISAQDEVGHLAEPVIVELNDGRLKMFMRNVTGFLHVSVSKDQGETWLPETATEIRMPCAPFFVRKDPWSGYLFLVWDNAFPGPVYQYPRSSIWMAVSKDNGESWLPITELDAHPDYNFGYPSIHFTSEEVWTAYYVDECQRGFDLRHNHILLKRFSRQNLACFVENSEKLCNNVSITDNSCKK